jgi:hypothetical protein
MGVALSPSCGETRTALRERPEDGDLVIVQARGSDTHSLAIWPALPQILCESRREAIRHARRFAIRHGIDAWLAEDGGAFSRVSHHLLATGVNSTIVTGENLTVGSTAWLPAASLAPGR